MSEWKVQSRLECVYHTRLNINSKDCNKRSCEKGTYDCRIFKSKDWKTVNGNKYYMKLSFLFTFPFPLRLSFCIFVSFPFISCFFFFLNKKNLFYFNLSDRAQARISGYVPTGVLQPRCRDKLTSIKEVGKIICN